MSLPESISGFPEFSPAEEVIAQRFMNIIRETYASHGLTPLETPAIERVSTLIGSGGGENEKQVYGIHPLSSEGDTKDSDLALHFDLTVPLARYVAQNSHTLTFPFARYQMQKVWRGETAAKGRFREFYQCDVDIIGRDGLSSAADAKVVSVIAEILQKFNIGDFTIRVNNRKFLTGYFSSVGIDSSLHNSVMTQIDKLDKRTISEVKLLLLNEAGLSESVVDKVLDFVTSSKSLTELQNYSTSENTDLKNGAEELIGFIKDTKRFGIKDEVVVIDAQIARGLDYYTGNVFETRLTTHPEIGSIASGGRYANLVSRFTPDAFPGVGMSIGLTRLLSQLFALNILTPTESSFAKVLLLNIDSSQSLHVSKLAQALREESVSCEEYLGDAKFGKQLEYASKKSTPFCLIIGEDEASRGGFTLRNMSTGSQEFYNTYDLDVCVGVLLGLD